MAAGMLMLSSGCIEETLPTGYVLGSQIESSPDAIAGMMNAVYTTMVNYSNDDGGVEDMSYGSLRVMLEHGTTALVCPGVNGWNTMGVYCYGAVSAIGSNRGIYPSYCYYGYLKAVNDVLALIDPDTDNADLRHYRGMCLAFRALLYNDFVQIMEYKKPTDPRYQYTFPEKDLTNLGVPIVTENTPASDLSHNPRATVDEVYDLVLSDLANAEKYLADFNRSDKIEPNLACVYGLYARVYQVLASRTEVSAKYKNATELWKEAIKYADLAITTSGCQPLTESEWLDPQNGFNNRNSQNSWMWATTISPSNVDAVESGFNFTTTMGNETNFIIYGWAVGRSLNRLMYEQLSDTDFRKKSWLAPNFFYESINQKAGEPYLVEKDENGALINNKWDLGDGDWSDDYSGWNGYKYTLNCPASRIRYVVFTDRPFQTAPWIYLNIKFRPAQGAWDDIATGAATDYPIMRVEEMTYIKAEAQFHTAGAGTAKTTLETLMKTRDANYPATAVYPNDFMKELNFQKQIEFWGEGINYFDAKRQALGLHRQYDGVNLSAYSHAIDVDGIFTGWTPGWNQAELTGNTAIHDYNNPYTAQATYYLKDNTWLMNNYGKPLDLSK